MAVEMTDLATIRRSATVALGMAAFVGNLAGCGSPPKPTVRPASARVRQSSGPWTTAWVEIESKPRYDGSIFCFKGGCNDNPATVYHWLDLEGPAGRAHLPLATGYLSRYSGAGTEPAAFEALGKTTYALRFAPDGHVLALSSDAGRHWRYVRVDTWSPTCRTHMPGTRDPPSSTLPSYIPGKEELYTPGPGGDPFAGVKDANGAPYVP